MGKEQGRECWGIRYCYSGLLLHNGAKKAQSIMRKTIFADMQGKWKGKCFIMESEKEDMGFFYIMFFDESERNAFYDKHTKCVGCGVGADGKRNKTARMRATYSKQAHMRKIKEKAIIPEEWFGKEAINNG